MVLNIKRNLFKKELNYSGLYNLVYTFINFHMHIQMTFFF
jgi:hypothetical protein